MIERLNSEKGIFYLTAGSALLSVIMAALSIYLNYYIVGAALVIVYLKLQELSNKNNVSSLNTDTVRITESTFESLREIAVLAALMTAPMVPSVLGVAVLSFYSFSHVLKLSLENSLKEDLYPLIGSSWRLVLIAGFLLGTLFNSYILFWAAWLLLTVYMLEIAQLFRHLL